MTPLVDTELRASIAALSVQIKALTERVKASAPVANEDLQPSIATSWQQANEGRPAKWETMPRDVPPKKKKVDEAAMKELIINNAFPVRRQSQGQKDNAGGIVANGVVLIPRG